MVHELHDVAEYKAGANSKPIDALEKDFVAMDRNNDGHLSEEELMFRQYATGCEPQEAQARGVDYFKCGDTNKDGQISLQEFKNSAGPSFAECIRNFDGRRTHGFVHFMDADTDFDSRLSKTELRVGILQLWGSPGDELVEPLMGCADKNKDGFMEQDEFHNAIAAYNPATRTWQMWNGTSDREVLTCMATAFKRFDAALVFHATDLNQDREISRSEAYETMRAVNGITLPQTTADAIFDAADKDKNKYLSLDEFAGAGEAYAGTNEASFFLGGGKGSPSSPYASDTKNEGYGMSMECHRRDGSPWRLFSDGLGQIRVNSTDTAGGVKVTQR